MKQKIFYDNNLYHTSLHLVYDCEPAAAMSVLTGKYKMDMKDEDSNHLGFFCMVENENYPYGMRGLLYSKQFKWTIQDQTTMIHELQHFVWRVLRTRGINLTPETEEAYTYYFDYWMEKIWEALKPLNPASKRKKKRS